jgi:hypothetical protein
VSVELLLPLQFIRRVFQSRDLGEVSGISGHNGNASGHRTIGDPEIGIIRKIPFTGRGNP